MRALASLHLSAGCRQHALYVDEHSNLAEIKILNSIRPNTLLYAKTGQRNQGEHLEIPYLVTRRYMYAKIWALFIII